MMTCSVWNRLSWALVAPAALLVACGGSSSAPPIGSDPAGTAAAAPLPSAPGDSPSNGAPGSDDPVAPGSPGDGSTGDGTMQPGAGGEGIGPDIGLAPGGPEETAASGSGQAPAAADAGASEPPPSEPPPAQPEPEPAGPITLYLAGDSIVQTYAETPSDRDQAGWGQMLPEFFDAEVTINNRAIGGRTARRFIDEGRLDTIVAELEPGDYLLVQFGTNDGNRTATYTIDGATIPYFLDPATDFRDYLQRYIDAARSRGANPVFVTPTPRNSAYCTGGNGTGAHAAAMSALGAQQGVPVVDLNARTVAHLRAICPAPTPENFFLLRADGSVDGTHFQENGARILASFVADGLSDVGAPFTEHRASAP